MRNFLNKIKNGVFLTATDTEVGKTAVAASLAAVLRQRGWDIGVMKPIASGCMSQEEKLVAEDAECLKKAANCEDSVDLVCPVRLKDPLAPTVAAERAHTTIDLENVRSAYHTLRKKHRCLIVEGIGGILVPITPTLLIADLAVEFGLPVIIVARPKLGTINHTLLTIEASRQRGLDVLGVIINRYPQESPGLAEVTSPKEIERCGKVPILAILREDPCVDIARCKLGSLPSELSTQIADN